MSYIYSNPSVQTQFTNFPARALPGQLYNGEDTDLFVESFPVDSFVFAGRMVVKAIDQTLDNDSLPVSAPYSVKMPGDDETANDLVGVPIRLFNGMFNEIDVADIANGQPNKAGYQPLSICGILPVGCGRKIWVEQSPSIGNVTAGSDVYVAVNATNDANVLVGQFATNALGTGGLVQVPGAKWVFTRSTTTSLEPINVIVLG